MKLNFDLPHLIQHKFFWFRISAVLVSAAWLIGGMFFAAVSTAQIRNKNANVKKTSPTPKKTATPKPTPKSTPKPTPKPAPQGQQFVVTGFNLNIREQPSASSEDAGQLKFGTIVRSVERSAKSATISGKTGFWHKIAPVGGKSGWVFGGFLKTFDITKRETIYKQITTDKFKIAKRSFDENAELYEFLTRAGSEVKTPSFAAEIGLWRLLALNSALEAIPFEEMENSPYKDFTDKHDANIVYSEPSGQWYVRSERFWTLAEKYQKLAIGEKIAWEAARNPIPGECEGYLNCYMFALRITHGEYLELYPKGTHAAESLKAIYDQLQPIVADAQKKEIYTTPADVSDRAEFYQKIAEIRSIVSRTGFFEKEAVLRQLNKIADGYR